MEYKFTVHFVGNVTVRILVGVEGANVYAKSRTGVTALTEAAANGHTEIVNLLNRHMLSTKPHLRMTSHVSLAACLLLHRSLRFPEVLHYIKSPKSSSFVVVFAHVGSRRHVLHQSSDWLGRSS